VAEAPAWSRTKLGEARALAEAGDTDALLIVEQGRVVAAWGRIDARFKCHSVRKSLLSALVGIEVEEGRLDLSATLADLDVDDREKLTERERQATVLDLLTARSGIYHPTVAETARMRAIREARGSHGPGTFWCYNNWDFNALGTIVERASGRSLFELFRDRIAAPLEMEDFRYDEGRRDGEYAGSPATLHPAYSFRLSARDLARFGLLYGRGGRWGDRQVVPRRWVRDSVRPYSDAGTEGAYGYMWWVGREGILFTNACVPRGTFAARGYRGHFAVVLPEQDIVIVHRVDSDQDGRRVNRAQFGAILDRLLEARFG
jgi:CubicO group peptidase (beta-lactamase class C family)